MDNHSEILAAVGKFSKHYENFPVASFLIPSANRFTIQLIYWFARTADDIADEGQMTIEKRIELLNQIKDEFNAALNQFSKIEFMNLLGKEVNLNNLSSKHFFNLLSAFSQDVVKKRYCDFQEILDYCSRSANPVGRLILEIFNYRSEELMLYSDKICTSLQLINFIQDTQIDIRKDRLYYPINELKEFAVQEEEFLSLGFNSLIKNLIKFNVNRAADLMNQGKPLIKYLKGRLAIEIKWTVLGGLEILKKIEKADYNVMAIRPKISKFDYSKIFLKSLLKL